MLGKDVWLPTPEDVILQNLTWNRPKDREDILGVMIANRAVLDGDYLSRLCEELNIQKLFDELWSECQDLGNE